MLSLFRFPGQTGTEKIEEVPVQKVCSEDGSTWPAHFRKSVSQKDLKDFQKRRKFKLHGFLSLLLQYNGIEASFPVKRANMEGVAFIGQEIITVPCSKLKMSTDTL